MPRKGAKPYGFGAYVASDYDELIDHPVEMGEFTRVSFRAGGVPHDIVITGRHAADSRRLQRDLKRLCEHRIRFFGGPAPMKRYVFLVTAVGEGYGGLEHRASAALLCSREDLPREGEIEVSERYRTFLGLVSHEYFHTWNVKRIKPAAFVPYDLDRENYTTLLWAFEGITSYYDDLALVRCGLIGAGLEEDGIERLAEEAAGLKLGRTLDDWLRSTRELPLKALLATQGVEMELRPAESGEDKGGRPARSKNAAGLAMLGIRARAQGDDTAVTHVLEGGAAQQAGIAAGDLIVAVEGLRPGQAGLGGALARRGAGERAGIHAFRPDELMSFEVQLARADADTCVLTESDGARRKLLERWLRPRRG